MECLCALAYAFRVRYNMNATEATILFQAGKYHQGVPFSELPIHGSQLTRAMDTLRGYGLVEDRYDPDNRKRKRVYLTLKGRRFVDELCDILTPN